MAQYGASITKEIPFRGGRQSFSNVYYYEGPALGELDYTPFLNYLVGKERTLHSQGVDFVEARLWSSGGAPAENEMLRVLQLTGTGAIAVGNGADPERAVLVQWSAGTNTLGRPVYLRKWFHLCGSNGPGSNAISTASVNQTAPLSTVFRDSVEAITDTLRTFTLSPLGTFELVAQSGRQTDADGICYAWLEHHNMGDQWRG